MEPSSTRASTTASCSYLTTGPDGVTWDCTKLLPGTQLLTANVVGITYLSDGPVTALMDTEDLVQVGGYSIELAGRRLQGGGGQPPSGGGQPPSGGGQPPTSGSGASGTSTEACAHHYVQSVATFDFSEVVGTVSSAVLESSVRSTGLTSGTTINVHSLGFRSLADPVTEDDFYMGNIDDAAAGELLSATYVDRTSVALDTPLSADLTSYISRHEWDDENPYLDIRFSSTNWNGCDTSCAAGYCLLESYDLDRPVLRLVSTIQPPSPPSMPPSPPNTRPHSSPSRPCRRDYNHDCCTRCRTCH